MKNLTTTICCITLLATAISACASLSSDKSGTISGEKIENAAFAPLSDLNLRRTPIPPLLEALDSPYDPIEPACPAIRTEIDALDEILGPDPGDFVPDDADQQSRSAWLAKEATNYALDTVESTTTSIIPFRSIVRRATGATAHEKAIRKAFDKGVQRRAYLKGIARTLDCLPPPPSPEAAPNPVVAGDT